MKKILLCLLVVGVGVFVTSCGKDDDEKTNYVIFDGTEYELDATTSDIYYYGCGDTHCNNDYQLYSVDQTVYMYIELYELATDAFSGGSFSIGGGNYDFSYFDDDYIAIGEASYYPTGGTVKATELSGTNKWRLDFNYTFEGGKTAKGNFTGTLVDITSLGRISKD